MPCNKKQQRIKTRVFLKFRMDKSLRVLFLPFIVLLQNKHTVGNTLAENAENLISAQPRISAHLE